MNTRRAWTVGIFSYVGLFGASLQLRGALLPSFGETFGVGESQLGLLASLGSVGFLATVLTVGVLASRLSIKPVLVGGLVGIASVHLLIASAPTYLVLLAGFLLAGVFQGCLNGLDRPVLSHLYPSNRGRVYNRQEMVWAIGATLGPLLAVAALALTGWRAAYVVLALAFLPIAVVLWRLEVPSLDGERALSRADVSGLVRTPAVGTMGGLIFLLSLVESGLFTWLPYYLAGELPQSVASLSLTVFLAAYVPGRYTFSVAATKVDNLTLVAVSAAVSTALLAVFIAVGGYASLGVVFLVGFVVSGMFPTLLAWATNTVPEFSGPINALAFGASGTGFMVFPVTMGIFAERYGMTPAMSLLVLAMGGFTLLAFVRLLGQRRRRAAA
ncbi:MFS transporter [Natronobiforma cellulositropha]|uniref:MFS transporter n=1 Tax=Natronobiforma cellulositropha TaxID=1679076 RepID=UPI0021D5E1F6|nr:MFS transporter [Natronobiforma cellulositropha]